MKLLDKFRSPAVEKPLPRNSNGRDGRPVDQPLHSAIKGNRDVRSAPLHAPTASKSESDVGRAGRFSNGLKEFLWQLEGIRSGRLLDLGAVSQDTLNFFIGRGFKVYTEDLHSSWAAFRGEEEARSRLAEVPDMSVKAKADRFLASNLHHPPEAFDAVLLWDLLDYLDEEVVRRVVATLTAILRPGGAVLAVFHTRMPERLQRYRVLDAQNVELVNSSVPVKAQRIFQNRELQALFEGFRSSKYFVGRDQLREGVFLK